MIKRKLITAGFVIAMAAMVMSGCKSGGTDKETTAAAAGETAGSQESGTASGETKSEEELTDEASLELGNYKGLTLTAVKAGVTVWNKSSSNFGNCPVPNIASSLTRYGGATSR